MLAKVCVLSVDSEPHSVKCLIFGMYKMLYARPTNVGLYIVCFSVRRTFLCVFSSYHYYYSSGCCVSVIIVITVQTRKLLFCSWLCLTNEANPIWVVNLSETDIVIR